MEKSIHWENGKISVAMFFKSLSFAKGVAAIYIIFIGLQ